MFQSYFIYNIILLMGILCMVNAFLYRGNGIQDQFWDSILKSNADLEMQFEFEKKPRQLRPLQRRDDYYQNVYDKTPVYYRGERMPHIDYKRLKSLLRDDTNKPVLMSDLKAAIDRIENKLQDFHKNFTNQIKSNGTTIDGLEHEATRPVYMKDLWLYFGKNFMNCYGDSCDSDDDGGVANIMAPGPDGRLDGIINLLQKGTGGKVIGSNVPNDKDITWVKLKVKDQ